MSLAALSCPGGRTAIWLAITSPAAPDCAMDSACDLSASEFTVPVRVTTPLSRSCSTPTSRSPACRNDCLILSFTSGDLACCWPQPLAKANVAAKITGAKPLHCLNEVISLSLNSVFSRPGAQLPDARFCKYEESEYRRPSGDLSKNTTEAP